MTHASNHMKHRPELGPEITEMIAATRIAWTKPKEDIWPEMLSGMEGSVSPAGRTKTRYLQVVRYAAAAVIALFISISAVMYFYTKSIETPAAQQAEVILPDGSEVNVYAQSYISYKPLIWKFSRTVRLRGEGFFDVQKGKTFKVISEKGETVVLGTEFKIYARNNDYRVTCISGKVKVMEYDYQNEAIINGGQKAILNTDGTFDIVDIEVQVPEDINNTGNNLLEEELDAILESTTVKATPPEKENNKTITGRPSDTKEQEIPEIKPDDEAVKNVINDQPKTQKQAAETGEPKEKEQATSSALTPPGNEQQERNRQKEATRAGNEKPAKDRFRESLTPEQIKILENPQMNREEKRKAFMESLSAEQQQLLIDQIETRERQGAGGKDDPEQQQTVKERQKMQMQDEMREGPGKENREENIPPGPENRETDKPGREGGSGKENTPQPGKGK